MLLIVDIDRYWKTSLPSVDLDKFFHIAFFLLRRRHHPFLNSQCEVSNLFLHYLRLRTQFQIRSARAHHPGDRRRSALELECRQCERQWICSVFILARVEFVPFDRFLVRRSVQSSRDRSRFGCVTPRWCCRGLPGAPGFGGSYFVIIISSSSIINLFRSL